VTKPNKNTQLQQTTHTELPESRPTLWTEYDRYEPGDVLRANCSSPPSRPQAELTLTINNIVVSSFFVFSAFYCYYYYSCDTKSMSYN